MDIGNETLTVEHSDGTSSKFDGYDAVMIRDLGSRGIVKAIEILGFSVVAIKKAYEKKAEEAFKLCDQYLREHKWILRETGEPIYLDEDFLQEYFGLEITKGTFYRQLKEKRASLEMVVEIISFCKNQLKKE